MKRFFMLMLLVIMLGGNSYADGISIPLSFSEYYPPERVEAALKALNRHYPGLTKLDLVGKSDEGRPIYALTINNPKSGPELDKPGIYVDGNIHGNEIQAAEVCLYLLDYLLYNYERNEEIKKLVDRVVFYVVPVVNIDGRHHFFHGPSSPNSNRSLRIPRDDDNDGLIDEDFPQDLDGDGNITQMRIADPFGAYRSHPEDPRLMVRVKPGEQGEWTLLGSEGIDNDGDGRINEDAEGYVDGNRNWGFDWMPDYVQRGAGDFPFQGVGLKALATYIRARPNIIVSWAFHNYGGMFLRGPSTKAQGEYHPADVAVYDFLGLQAERITPGYRYLISWKDLYATYGDFGEWMAMLNGSFNFVGELFLSEQETFRTVKDEERRQREKMAREEDARAGMFGGGNELERLQFSDHLTLGELYKPWKPFKHPQFGDIEIGGWVKMSTRLPAPFMLKDLVHRNAMAVVFSARQTPQVSMEILEAKKIGRNLHRVRVRLVNTNAIPTMSQHAQKVKLYPLDQVTAAGRGLRVLAGGTLINTLTDEVRYKEHRPELQFLSVPGFGKVDLQFLVSGNGNLELSYKSRHAGRKKVIVKL